MRTTILCSMALWGTVFFSVSCKKSNGGGDGNGGGGNNTGGSGDSTIVVTTIAGSYNPGPSAVCTDAQGNVYASGADYVIRKITISPAITVSIFAGSTNNPGCEIGTGTSATFTDPIAICSDAQSNIYVADYDCVGIKKVSPAAVVSLFCTNDIANNVTIDGPQTIGSDLQGNIYSGDPLGEDGITKVTPVGTGSHFAGDGVRGYKDGAVGSAEFSGPTGICGDGQGNVYVADGHRIRKISNGQVTTLAGNELPGYADGTGANAKFGGAMGICLDSKGNIYVADSYNNMIRMVTPDGVVSSVVGTGDAGSKDGNGTVAQFNEPTNLCFDAQGNLYVADYGSGNVRKVTFKK